MSRGHSQSCLIPLFLMRPSGHRGGKCKAKETFWVLGQGVGEPGLAQACAPAVGGLAACRPECDRMTAPLAAAPSTFTVEISGAGAMILFPRCVQTGIWRRLPCHLRALGNCHLSSFCHSCCWPTRATTKGGGVQQSPFLGSRCFTVATEKHRDILEGALHINPGPH